MPVKSVNQAVPSVASPFLNTLTPEERMWLQRHPVITVAQDPDWPPVEFVDSRGEPSGMSRDYLSLVEQRLGVKFKQIKGLTWQDAFARMRNWDIDMATCVASSSQREGFWAFTTPYIEIPVVIVTSPDVTYIAEMKELTGKKVAVVQDYAIAEWIAKDFPAITLIKVPTAIKGLEMLQRGEVFAYIDNLLIVGDYQAKMKITGLKIAGNTPYVNAQCMAVRKDWPVLRNILQKALDSISDSERQEIYRKWLPVRYEYGFNYSNLWPVAGIVLLIIFGLLFWNRMLSKEISCRKKAEQERQESEIRFRRLLEMMPIPLAYISMEGKVIFYNERFVRVFGYTTDDLPLLADWWVHAYPDPEYRKLVMSTWEKLLHASVEDGKDVEAHEYEITCKNGEKRNMLISGITLGNAFMAVFVDLTEQKRKQEELIESDRKLKEAQKLAQLGHWSWDVKTGKVEWSDEVYKIFHVDPETFIPTANAILELSPWPEEHQRTQELMRIATANHEKGSFEQRFLFHDQTIGYYHSTFQGEYDDNGELVSIVGTIMDITARKRAEEEREKLENQLRQAQKMESVGRLAGGVAHDFNNMLGVILGRSEIAIRRLGREHPACVDLDEIRKAAERSADLTRQLLAFARKQTIAPKVMDLNATVEGMLKMLQRLIGENIQLNWLPGANLGKIKIDPSQIDQILANLCVNSRDAISDVGFISIETENRYFDDSYCAGHADVTPGEYVLLIISDSGCGMSKDALAHVFEPFYTTKSLGKGTGLGLATVYGIVRQNNGFINVYSEPGRGTTFNICLPRYIGDESVIIRSSGSETLKGGNETVLLVEDEPALLVITADMLANQGYNVLSANSPEEAFRIALENKGPIDLLLSDVVMPGMNGRELAKRLSVAYPQLKCLFMSGYTANVIAHHGVLEEGVHFIAKPFSINDLSRKIREVLTPQ